MQLTNGVASGGVMSFFAKQNTHRYVQAGPSSSISKRVFFDLQDGVMATIGGSAESYYGIEDYGNGWYRCYVAFGDLESPSIFTAAGDGSSFNDNNYTGDGSGVYIYGTQVEQNVSYKTSYIPTHGSSVTRSGDNMDTTFSLPLTSDGNVSVLFDLNAAPKTDTNSTSNNLEFVFSNGDRIIYNQNSVSWHRIELNVNGGTEFIYKTFGILRSVPAKICVVVTNKEYRIFVNGQLTSSVGSFTGTADWTAAERFASDITSTIGVIPMKQLVFFPTALTDSECIKLTTI